MMLYNNRKFICHMSYDPTKSQNLHFRQKERISALSLGDQMI